MKIAEILRFLEAEQVPFVFRGDESAEVERFSSLSRYQPGTFTWVKKQENIPAGFDCAAVALAFVSQGVTGHVSQRDRNAPVQARVLLHYGAFLWGG